MTEEYKRYAFISYNHKDLKWAKWLHKKLESYRLPSEIHNEFEDTRYMRPVFRDQADLNTGILSETLKDNLISSKYLIVICSPNSAKSTWVNDEVSTFISLGRLDRIIPLIVDGNPHSYTDRDAAEAYEDECFPLALRQLTKEDSRKELLGVSIAEVGKSKAFIRIVSRMLEVSFDSLWKRHKRQQIRNTIITSLTALVLAALLYWLALPVQVSVTLKDEPSNLPAMEQGTLTIGGTEYTVTSPDTTITLKSFPGYYRLRSVPVTFRSEAYYDTISTDLKLTAGTSQSETIQLHRNSRFAIFAGTVINDEGTPIEGAKVEVEGQTTETDTSGKYKIQFPLAQQTETKRLTVTCPGYQTMTRDHESPGKEAQILLEK